MIEFKNVYKAYKNKPVLSNISLTIQDDEFFVQRVRQNHPVEDDQQTQ